MLTKEELTNTYLKYTPEITEKVYNDIIKRLLSLGYKWHEGDNSYEKFVNKYNYLKIDPYKENTIRLIGHFNSDEKEIFVKDIIGEEIQLIEGNWYEIILGDKWIFKFKEFEFPDKIWASACATPHDKYTGSSGGFLRGKPEDCKPADMKEVYELFPDEKPKEFVLPEKWCIYIDNDYSVVKPWFDEKLKRNVKGLASYWHFPEIRFNVCTTSKKDSDYTEITFEQFKKYVINEEKHPIPKQSKVIDSWCVKVTKKNREVVKQWINYKGYSISIHTYYGINNAGNKYGNMLSSSFDKIISTEEFYKKIGHVDSSKSEQEFKVGDWVYSEQASNDDDYRRDHDNGDKFIPVFQIEEIFQKEWARPVKGQSSGILTKHLRLATPEEIAFVTKSKLRFDYKFKIGDKVRIVKKGMGYSPECIGEVVEILELGEYLGKPGYRTSKTKGTSNTNNGFCNSMAEERSFELYTEEVMFEKDKWYKYSKDYFMFGCYQKDGMGYGFTVSKKWTDTLSMSDTNWLPATNEEVKEILLKYAKEKYPVGTKFISVTATDKQVIAEHEPVYELDGRVDKIGTRDKGTNGIIYYNGKWAEIVSKPITTGKGILEQVDKQVDKQPKRWKVGDKVTYKSRKECGGKYKFGGGDQEGFIGKIKEYRIYNSSEKCWEINVTTKSSTYIMLESEFKEWDNPKNDELSFLENLGTESKEIPPCKEGDYLYLIDAIIDKKSSEYKEYKKYTGTILKVTNISSDNYAKNCWWIKYTPTLFGGGGCRINGNGWQWNKHIRLATSYEISINKAEWSIPDSSVISQITKEEKVEVQLISVPKI